ncbi:hypothetical protein AUJ67_08705 [Candidatus Desantisbacteria bacterium CG1_02_49_89]|nr:MAG: hypothetical protein AUJ67_08705 [Candidatus Desantisbacteria bacterium CG1_02_49_89]
MGSVNLSVIIPVYNESDRILPALDKVVPYLSGKGITWEVIIVDDGSTDNTAQLVEKYAAGSSGVKLLANSRNRGKGCVVRQGVLASSGERVLFTDVDLSAPIEEAEKLLSCLDEGYDVAIGSRALKESNASTTFLRKFIGLTFNFIVRKMLLPGIVDTQCGFKCFKGDVARDLFSRQKTEGFGFDVEILCLADMGGYRMKQVPINWFQSPSSRVNIFRDSIRMFFEILEIRGRLKDRRKA